MNMQRLEGISLSEKFSLEVFIEKLLESWNNYKTQPKIETNKSYC